ncbi:MAG: 4Fe-4S dicluster domain-containing protein [Candidatus Aminicenantes bacterium]|nr:4Fe-4S dicluster domain-containing protein [Candidatus Aminicenantes bacterium]
MCEFCHRHGEGKTWYLQAKHYGEDLLADLKRRDYMERFFVRPERHRRGVDSLQRLDRLPAVVRRLVTRTIASRMKRRHYGQVVPLEDVERVFDFVTSIVRLACLCRHVTVGPEKRYCYAVALVPKGGERIRILREIDAKYILGPETAGLETLDKEAALALFREHENEGLCHTAWTFETPFIGGFCNCDRSDCLAMQSTFWHQVPLILRAEYVAEVSPALCGGCRECLRLCQFGALRFSAAVKKVAVDPRLCYGCGVCRAGCSRKAIRLVGRATVPAAAGLW